MKKSFIIFLIIFGVLWGVGLFISFVAGISKSFNAKEPSVSPLSAQNLKSRQKKIAEETEEQRKIFMENFKQRVRDSQRNF